ncbi:hypothetical protein KDJ56_00635 [Brevibacillus composti]|uniref:DUF3951 domain-containing protein n=1 Tax=Brevibacillus composti TaxID=2796470 RepID=A0A7T5JNX4_9BACL|nr:hypothetical protein [Brevibacillus composti]QQE74552.1 hypothetical protein JD108_00635 [Brevibacillus composti]QUO41634.1 hypothetical protein KDJ56_00635 [Brevibacillus composti]
MSAIAIGFTFMIAASLLWMIFSTIKNNKLPKKTDYTPFDDMMSGRVDKGPIESFMNQNENEKEH